MNLTEPQASTPQKSMRLFQMFAESPTKGSYQNSPTKARTTNVFERSSNSP